MAMGVGLRPTTKAVEEPPNPNARAPRIYPDCCHRSPLARVAYGFPFAGLLAGQALELRFNPTREPDYAGSPSGRPGKLEVDS